MFFNMLWNFMQGNNSLRVELTVGILVHSSDSSGDLAQTWCIAARTRLLRRAAAHATEALRSLSGLINFLNKKIELVSFLFTDVMKSKFTLKQPVVVSFKIFFLV